VNRFKRLECTERATVTHSVDRKNIGGVTQARYTVSSNFLETAVD